MRETKIEPQKPSTPGNAKHESRQVHKKNGYNPKKSANTSNSETK